MIKTGCGACGCKVQSYLLVARIASDERVKEEAVNLVKSKLLVVYVYRDQNVFNAHS